MKALRLPGTVWLVLAILLAPLALRSNGFYMHLANLSVIFAVAVVGYNICFGDAGQISLGHAGFFALGAYSTALLTVDWHLPVVAGILLAAILPTAVAAVVGVPCLKLRGHYLALATVGLGEIVRLVAQNWDAVTHGTQGVRNIPKLALGGIAVQTEFGFYYVAIGCLVVFAAAAVRLGRSRFGVALKAVRDDELAARCSGLPAVRLKVLAFSISALYAGVAGALYAHLNGYVSPDFFNFDLSILFLIMLIVGGIRSIAGCVLGSVILTFLPELLRFAQLWYLLIYGVAVILMVVYLPGGLVGAARRLVWTRLAPLAQAAGTPGRQP